MIWLGDGVLKVGKEYIGKGEEFDPDKVEKVTLDKLIAEKKIGEKERVKVVKKKKDKQ